MGARSAALVFATTNPFRGSVLCGNAQNPTVFTGNVFLLLYQRHRKMRIDRLYYNKRKVGSRELEQTGIHTGL
jgi:hypothetical protein